jgi:hypothetical protein
MRYHYDYDICIMIGMFRAVADKKCELKRLRKFDEVLSRTPGSMYDTCVKCECVKCEHSELHLCEWCDMFELLEIVSTHDVVGHG